MAFCSKCGANIDDAADFCSVCGEKTASQAQSAAVQPAAPQFQSATPQRMIHCPHCKSSDITITTESSVDGAVTSSAGRFAATSVSNTHRNYWICKNCGAKFRNIQNLEEEIVKVEKNRKSCMIVCIITAIISLLITIWLAGMEVPFTFVILAGGVVVLIPFIIAVVTFIFIFVYKNRAAKLKQERDFLRQNCFN